MIHLGYPTQNLTIPTSTNRTCSLVSLQDAGKVRGLIRENLSDLETILRWNAEYGVALFRIGQSLIPFASHHGFPYDWTEEHGNGLRRAGEFARTLGTVSACIAASTSSRGASSPSRRAEPRRPPHRAIHVLDLIGSPDSTLVLHMGGSYGDKPVATARFIEVMRPEEGVLKHLALENDERVWTVAEVVKTARALSIPTITDTPHHALNPGGLALEEAFGLSLPTWQARGTRPNLHLSSQNPDKQAGAPHAYSIELADWQALVDALGDREADVMVEAKGKEHTLASRWE